MEIGVQHGSPHEEHATLNEQLTDTFNQLSLENSHLVQDAARTLHLSPNDDDDGESLEEMNIDEVEQAEHLKSPTQHQKHVSGDANLAVDEEFQNSLNERANQFLLGSKGNSINTNNFAVPRPEIVWEHDDQIDLVAELDKWFTKNELHKLHSTRSTYMTLLQTEHFNELNDTDRASIIYKLTVAIGSNEATQKQCIISLLYISIGAFGDVSNFNHHLSRTIENNISLMRANSIPLLISLFKEYFSYASSVRYQLAEITTILFAVSTILYFMICVLIDQQQKGVNVKKFIGQFKEFAFLEYLSKSIHEWRWNSRSSMRIRNIISITSKMIQLQFGDFKHRSSTKEFLNKKYGIVKQTNPNKLTASPLDYFAFRKDLIARYPSFIPPPSSLPESFETHSSLSQFISVPRTNSNSKINESLPVPEVHISTPAPSPPASPMSIGGRTFKIKRSYQTNQNYPFLYPTNPEDETVEDVPISIKEASEIFSSRVEEKLSLKQLWFERDLFMRQERGWVQTLNDESLEDDFDSKNEYSDEFVREIDSLQDVEHFYSESIEYLPSLVHVLLQVIVSYKTDFELFDYNEGPLDAAMETRLEVIRAKEITLRDSSFILLSLLKWFKINHVLKFEHLCTLIYDDNFFTIVMNYLRTIEPIFIDKVLNKQTRDLSSSFWRATSLSEKVADPKVDADFCFTLTNLLKIASMVCSNKTQRILAFSEKDPANVLKSLLSVYNLSIWDPLLKIIKNITPFNGKKWKSNNMDLISLVYLHKKLHLRDNWLTGKDLDGELSDAYGQEIAFRAIIQFYHMRRYSKHMENMGYKKKETDFFTREMELLATF